jgi:glycogen operon protein
LYRADSQERLHVILNAYWEPLAFDLPPAVAGRSWRRLVDTSLPTGQDFCDPPMPLAGDSQQYACQARSSVILVEFAR